VAVEDVVEFAFELVFGEGRIGALDADGFEAGGVERGADFEGGLEAEGLAFYEEELGDLGLRDGLGVLLGEGLAEFLVDEGFEDFLADFLGEAGLDERCGYLAGAEAGDARELLVALVGAAVGLVDFFNVGAGWWCSWS
jgi:hypothetical protein